MKNNKLKELRIKNNLTQKQLCVELEDFGLSIATSQIHFWENGYREPRKFETWSKIAKYFKVEVSFLLGI